jgi:hypothetical protein
VNPFSQRVRTATAVCGLVAVAALTGCSAGQQAQTALTEPAVNGTKVTVNNIALRDIQIRAIQTSDALKPGKTVDLALVATNQSPDTPDTLVAVTTDIGNVALTGNATLAPGGTLIVGAPDQVDAKALAAVQAASTATATLTLTQPISNGLTYGFTFQFAHAGQASVKVPISAGAGVPPIMQAAQSAPR